MRDNDTEDSDGTINTDDLDGPVVDRRTTLSLLGAVGLGSLAGCTGGGGDDGGGGTTTTTADETATTTAPPEQDVSGGRLTAGWNIGSIETLDPPKISVGQYFQVAANIFNGLVWLAPDLTVRGDLAKDWTVENDGRTFTFDLREGVTFHNGVEFTAEDVQYTIDRTIAKETPAAAKLSTLKRPIEGTGVKIVDDYTVQLNFEKPMAPALIYLTRGPGRAATIVNKEAIEEMGPKQYALTPVGTGPFEVASHEVGSELKLDANDDYFKTDDQGRQLPYLDGVDIKPIPEAATLVNALRSGGIDFANLVPLQNVQQVEQATSITKLTEPGINWLGLAMNERRKPFDSRKARRGIAKVIDRDAYVRTAYFGNALASTGPINKGTRWVWRGEHGDDGVGGPKKAPDQNYAPEEGKRLIEEAGASGAEFAILTTGAGSSLREAKAIQQQLDGLKGFSVSIDQVTNATYWDRYAKLDYDVTVSGSVGDPDPDQSLWNFYRKKGPWNWVDYEDDRVHQLLAEQRRTLDREQRKRVLWEIEDLLIADAPHVYLAHRDDIAAKRPNVKGFVHIPFMRYFQNVYLEQ
ncbi:MAG: ABC transporter substrate-binding protein [Halanaeroarchaeum sp.]